VLPCRLNRPLNCFGRPAGFIAFESFYDSLPEEVSLLFRKHIFILNLTVLLTITPPWRSIPAGFYWWRFPTTILEGNPVTGTHSTDKTPAEISSPAEAIAGAGAAQVIPQQARPT